MALVVCCPCGHPLDCDNIHLLVSVACPVCERELVLEFEDDQDQPRRAILTIMKGPYWIGEQFVLPVGENLCMGTASGNWLSLEGNEISEIHCLLRLTKTGDVLIQDQKSQSGTWISDKRIAQGKLRPEGSFRLGEFCFRLDYAGMDGTTISTAALPTIQRKKKLPTMARVQSSKVSGGWLLTNRFLVARWFVLAFAGLIGIHHFCHFATESDWGMPRAALAGIVTLGVIVASARYTTLARRGLRYMAVAAIAVAGVLEMVLGLPTPAVASFGLAACLTGLITQTANRLLTILGTTLGSILLVVMTIVTIGGISAFAGSL